jgi:hypothetical protein
VIQWLARAVHSKEERRQPPNSATFTLAFRAKVDFLLIGDRPWGAA